MQKKYRLDDVYLLKLEEIKKYVSMKNEYTETKVYDATVIKIIIDFYYDHINGNEVSTDYLKDLQCAIELCIRSQLTSVMDLFRKSLEHSNKESEIANILLTNVLGRVSEKDDLENLEIEKRFVEIAKEIVEDELNDKSKKNN